MRKKLLVATGLMFIFFSVSAQNEGSFDANFGTNGIYSTALDKDLLLTKLAVSKDNKIIAVGKDVVTNQIYVQKIALGGTLEPSFGVNGEFVLNATYVGDYFAVVINSNGEIIVAYTESDEYLRQWKLKMFKLTSDGQQVTSFGVNGLVEYSFTKPTNTLAVDMPKNLRVAVNETDKIFVVGNARVKIQDSGSQVGNYEYAFITAFNDNGSENKMFEGPVIDWSQGPTAINYHWYYYGTNFRAQTEVEGIYVFNNKLLLYGGGKTGGGYILRLDLTTGKRDDSFNPTINRYWTGVRGFSSKIKDVIIQDGKYYTFGTEGANAVIYSVNASDGEANVDYFNGKKTYSFSTVNNTTGLFFEYCNSGSFIILCNDLIRKISVSDGSLVQPFTNNFWNNSYYGFDVHETPTDFITMKDSSLVYVSSITVQPGKVSRIFKTTATHDYSNEITGFSNAENLFQVWDMYPNPANTHVNITYSDYLSLDGYNIKIINSNSQEVYNDMINSNSDVIDINTIGSNGLYFIQLYNANNELVEVRKLLIQ